MKTLPSEELIDSASFNAEIKKNSDKVMDGFLLTYFLGGLIFACFYDTWLIAIGVGGLSLLAYYCTKWALPDSSLYQFVLSSTLR